MKKWENRKPIGRAVIVSRKAGKFSRHVEAEARVRSVWGNMAIEDRSLTIKEVRHVIGARPTHTKK